jgi:predicted O-methyltransferase YrrM
LGGHLVMKLQETLDNIAPSGWWNVPNDKLKDCVVLSERTDVFSKMSKNGNVGELGVFDGDGSAEIIKICNPKNLHLFEIDDKKFDLLEKRFPQEDVYLERGDASQNLEKFDDDYFDWVFIDSNHDYNSTKRELEISHKKVGGEGWILLHDYIIWTNPVQKDYGVVPAVNEFIMDYDYRVRYLSLEHHGFHTIAISL